MQQFPFLDNIIMERWPLVVKKALDSQIQNIICIEFMNLW